MNHKKISTVAGMALAIAALAGCQSSSKTASAHKPPLAPTVTDISPTPPAPAYAAPVQPIQPVAAAQPVEAAPQSTPAAFTGAAATAGGKYTVQKGDTLFRIAKEKYGDGKQWTRIAQANPGLSPSTLKVGQKIVIP